MTAQTKLSKTAIALAACLAALILPAQAADKPPRIIIKPAAPFVTKSAPARAATSDPDQILCMAGCDSLQPVVVQERPPVPYVGSTLPQWVEPAWGVHCADGLGCIARDVLPMPSRWCCEHSHTIVIYRDRRWR